jgi:hypothetical protein
MLVTKPAPGPPAPSPDFVEDQGHVTCVTQLAHALGEAIGVDVDAALSLDGLHEHAGRLVVDGGGERVEIAGLDVREPGNLGAEARADRRVARRRDHCQRAPVKALLQRDELPPPRRFRLPAQACELHRPFVRLRAAVAEKRLAGERVAIQPLRQFDLWFTVKCITDVPQPLRLLRRGGDQLRMRMPEDRPAESCE